MRKNALVYRLGTNLVTSKNSASSLCSFGLLPKVAYTNIVICQRSSYRSFTSSIEIRDLLSLSSELHTVLDYHRYFSSTIKQYKSIKEKSISVHKKNYNSVQKEAEALLKELLFLPVDIPLEQWYSCHLTTEEKLRLLSELKKLCSILNNHEVVNNFSYVNDSKIAYSSGDRNDLVDGTFSNLISQKSHGYNDSENNINIVSTDIDANTLDETVFNYDDYFGTFVEPSNSEIAAYDTVLDRSETIDR